MTRFHVFDVRRWCLAAATAVVLTLAGGARPADAANVSISISYFYDNLSPYGQWIDEPRYGWCWSPSPRYVSAGWRPYSDGHWVYTDWGWTWVSDEPWGWAAYHYGRWYYDPYEGWIWIPGTDWAPAWVAWRYSPEYDYVGWAPLPPDAGWSGWAGLDYVSIETIPTRSWCFVREDRFVSRDVQSYVVPFTQNTTYIRRTQDAPRIQLRGGRPFNPGISVATFERSGLRVPRMRVTDLASRPRSGSQIQQRGAVAFFRPSIRRDANAAPRLGIDRRGNDQRQAGRLQEMRRGNERPQPGWMDRQQPQARRQDQGWNQRARRDEFRRYPREAQPAQMNLPQRRERPQRADNPGGGRWTRTEDPGLPPDLQPNRDRGPQRPDLPDMHRPQPPERQQPPPQRYRQERPQHGGGGPPPQQYQQDRQPRGGGHQMRDRGQGRPQDQPNRGQDNRGRGRGQDRKRKDQ